MKGKAALMAAALLCLTGCQEDSGPVNRGRIISKWDDGKCMRFDLMDPKGRIGYVCVAPRSYNFKQVGDKWP